MHWNSSKLTLYGDGNKGTRCCISRCHWMFYKIATSYFLLSTPFYVFPPFLPSFPTCFLPHSFVFIIICRCQNSFSSCTVLSLSSNPSRFSTICSSLQVCFDVVVIPITHTRMWTAGGNRNACARARVSCVTVSSADKRDLFLPTASLLRSECNGQKYYPHKTTVT